MDLFEAKKYLNDKGFYLIEEGYEDLKSEYSKLKKKYDKSTKEHRFLLKNFETELGEIKLDVCPIQNNPNNAVMTIWTNFDDDNMLKRLMLDNEDLDNKDFLTSSKFKDFILAFCGDIAEKFNNDFDNRKYDINDFEIDDGDGYYLPDVSDEEKYDAETWYYTYKNWMKNNGKLNYIPTLIKQLKEGFKDLDWSNIKKYLRNTKRYNKAVETTRRELNNLQKQAVEEYIQEKGIENIEVGDKVVVPQKGARWNIYVKVKNISKKTVTVEDQYGNEFNVRASTILKNNKDNLIRKAYNKAISDWNKE